LPHLPIGDQRINASLGERGQIGFGVISRVGSDQRVRLALIGTGVDDVDQQFLFGAGAMRRSFDNDLVRRIDDRDRAIALNDAFAATMGSSRPPNRFRVPSNHRRASATQHGERSLPS